MRSYYLPFTLTLRSPAALTALGGDPNSRTLPYIPGSALRGALARTLGALTVHGLAAFTSHPADEGLDWPTEQLVEATGPSMTLGAPLVSPRCPTHMSSHLPRSPSAVVT
jgi:hypothetical protein